MSDAHVPAVGRLHPEPLHEQITKWNKSLGTIASEIRDLPHQVEAGIVRWLRGGGYEEAANALAELHVEDCALRGKKPAYFVEALRAAGEIAPSRREKSE